MNHFHVGKKKYCCFGDFEGEDGANKASRQLAKLREERDNIGLSTEQSVIQVVTLQP